MTVSRRQAGFTMVEMVVIIGIIGILAAIGIPSFRGLMPRMRLNTDTMTLSNEISLARMRAISKSMDFRITFDTANMNYDISKFEETTPGSGVWTWKSLGTTTMVGTQFQSVTGFNTPNVLLARGTGAIDIPLSSQAFIVLQTPDGTLQKRIVVEPTGRMFVQRKGFGGTTWGDD